MGRPTKDSLVALLCGATVVAGIGLATTAQAQESLRGLADARGKLIGAAVATDPLANEQQYSETLAAQFNTVTAENAMKWDATEPSQGQFNWSGADAIMDFAEANDQSVHGHTLVWHSQTPSWVQGLPADQMRAAMENHISEVVGRYQGRIESWDVVNEAFDDDGSMRESFWYQTLGESYIADAFRYAHAADPDAKLCINDYNVDGINDKSDAMYDLVSGLLDAGVPIDCVGVQGHLAIQYGFPGHLQENIQRFADLGVDVKITELDIRMELPVDDSKLATQATYYRDYLDACLAVERCLGVTMWGFTDKYSWVPDTFEGQGAALPYDETYQPKPAYTAIHDALASPSHGQAEGMRDLADERGVHIGAGITANDLGEADYAETLDREYNSITPGNEMKWEWVEPRPGEYNWADADAIVDHAEANDQQVRGHTLVWHSQLPTWLTEGGFPANELRGILREHVTTEVSRYEGRLAAWDVVNEPFEEDGTFRNSLFYEALGEEYIADALTWANDADPDAELYINDYNIEGINAKSDAMYDLVRSLLQQGVPLDGVGIQGHLIVGQVPATMRENIERFTELGLEVAITELDVRIEMPADESELAQQASDYGEVMTACLAVAGCVGTTTWGVTDKYSWIPDTFPGWGAALPFDETYTPKPAYDALVEALSS